MTLSAPAAVPISVTSTRDPARSSSRSSLSLARQVRRRHLWECARDAVLFWLGSRVALAAFTYLTLTFAAGHAGTDARAALSLPDALSRWQSWDTANFYDKIALHGYPSSDQGMADFFPLYPLLIRGILVFIGTGPGQVIAAGLFVSNGALLAALVGLALLVSAECDSSRGARLTALHLALAYPLAFFVSASGSDGVFLACAVWTLYAARRGWWLVAAGVAALAGLDRLTALVLVAPLVWEYGRQHDWQRVKHWKHWKHWRPAMLRRAARRDCQRFTVRSLAHQARAALEAVAVAVAAPLGVGLFFAWLKRVYGTPAVFFSIETGYFNHHPSWPWQVAGDIWRDWHAVPFFSYGMARGLMDSAPLLAALALTLAAALGWGQPRRLPAVYLLYVAGVVWLSSSAPIVCGGRCFPSDSLTSAGRYLTAAFPLLLPLVFWSRRRPWLAQALTATGMLAQAGILVWFLLRLWIV